MDSGERLFGPENRFMKRRKGFARSTAAGVLAFLWLIAGEAVATGRSPAVRSAFVRANPCPSTGLPRGRCAGWQVDHIRALCAGGADAPDNMQWLTVRSHKLKTADDGITCRRRRRAG